MLKQQLIKVSSQKLKKISGTTFMFQRQLWSLNVLRSLQMLNITT